MFGNTMSTAKAVVRAVNRYHVVVQLLTADQPEDQFHLIGQDEKIPFSQTDFEVLHFLARLPVKSFLKIDFEIGKRTDQCVDGEEEIV